MKNGPYELIIAPKKYPGRRYRGRYAYEHHVVYWRKFGVVVQPGQVVHHLNGDKRDNRISNLELTTNSAHSKTHGLERSIACLQEVYCGFCGGSFWLRGSEVRTRLKNRTHGRVFCSLSCGAKHQFMPKS